MHIINGCRSKCAMVCGMGQWKERLYWDHYYQRPFGDIGVFRWNLERVLFEDWSVKYGWETIYWVLSWAILNDPFILGFFWLLRKKQSEKSKTSGKQWKYRLGKTGSLYPLENPRKHNSLWMVYSLKRYRKISQKHADLRGLNRRQSLNLLAIYEWSWAKFFGSFKSGQKPFIGMHQL